MENASRALIMAAEVLIGILILTLAVYLINIFGKNAKQQEEIVYKKNLTEFNNKFTKYETPPQNLSLAEASDPDNGHKKADEYITSADVVTVVNLARQTNIEYSNNDPSSENYINVTVDGANCTNISESQWITKEKSILENSTASGTVYKRYNCQIILSQDTGKVRTIIIRNMF